jgi:hypothetical protein
MEKINTFYGLEAKIIDPGKKLWGKFLAFKPT